MTGRTPSVSMAGSLGAARPLESGSSPIWAELVAAASQRLAEAGVLSPRREAEELAAFVLGTPWSRLALHLRERPGEEQCASYRRLIEERSKRIPLQSITGVAGFRKLTLEMSPGVFIPRPETETLVQVVLDHLELEKDRTRPVRILEIGTGSGAVALSLASEFPASRILATDISWDALACASRNARRLRLGKRVHLVAADAAAVFGDRADSHFDVVVSNPPYVPTREIDGLQPEVKDHDPNVALDGGADGRTILRRILEDSPRLLQPGGLLAVEVGDGQAQAILSEAGTIADLRAAGMRLLDPATDISGRPRVLRARKLSGDRSVER